MTDAEKRESAIRGLECCILADPDSKSNCVECPYNHEGIITNAPCANGLMTDVLALLREQKPRVLTKNEVTQYLSIASNGFQAAEIDEPPLWTEYKNPQKYDVKWVTFGMVYSRMNDWGMSLDYGKEFRFWTAKPSPEQIRETKWEGNSDD